MESVVFILYLDELIRVDTSADRALDLCLGCRIWGCELYRKELLQAVPADLKVEKGSRKAF